MKMDMDEKKADAQRAALMEHQLGFKASVKIYKRPCSGLQWLHGMLHGPKVAFSLAMGVTNLYMQCIEWRVTHHPAGSFCEYSGCTVRKALTLWKMLIQHSKKSLEILREMGNISYQHERKQLCVSCYEMSVAILRE